MDNLAEALKHPEYVHLLLNPIPAYVLATGLLLLAIALMRKSRELQIAALWVLVFVGITAFPTWYYGHRAFDHLRESLTETSKQWAYVHIHRADRFVYFLYLTGALALMAIFLPRKFPKAAGPLSIAALVVGIGAFGLVNWISRAGGEIRHSELRMGPPPPAPVHEHNHKNGHDHHEPEKP